MGQGYHTEPIKVPLYNGDNGAAVLTRLLGEGNYSNTGSIASAFYLSSIKDSDTRSVNIPQYILNEAGAVGPKGRPDWLGEFDYTSMSGWMYAVNNVFPGHGFSDYFPQNGDVIRSQLTVYGYGSDVRSIEDGGFILTANKDALTVKIAEINSDPNKVTLLSKVNVKTAYDHAYVLLGTKYGWLKVTYNGSIGYVYDEYVDMLK